MNRGWVVLLTAVMAHSAWASEAACPSDLVALNAPGIELGGATLACDASPAAPGMLNECGMLKWAAQVVPAYQDLQREDHAFIKTCRDEGGGPECGQGKFSPNYRLSVLRAATVELSIMDGTGEPPRVSLEHACRWLARGIAVPVKPKDLVFPNPRFTFTRDVADPQNSRGRPFEAPFVINAIHDREKDKSTIGIYGTVGYRLTDEASLNDVSLSAKIDSAASTERKKSNVVIGLNWQRYVFPRRSRWLDFLLFRVSPEYLTDRGFEREAYQLTAKVSLGSQRFWRAGYVTCPGGCDVNRKAEFYWSPSLALEAGDVVEAAGSDTLLLVQQQGRFVRFVPGVTISFKPTAWSDRLTFKLQYAHRYDLTQGWDRGVGALSVDYAIAKNAFWNLTWRKGRQEVTLQPIDTILFGIGIRQ